MKIDRKIAFLGMILACGAVHSAPVQANEYIIVSGGPSLIKWEKYKAVPHDRWWGNFIRTARVRIQQLQAERGLNYPITWFVYKPAYVTRSLQEGRDLIALINSVRDRYGIRLIYFDRTEQLINYLNHGQDRSRVKVEGFEFFGHSNKAAFMFDYSNYVDSGSRCWLHETELGRIEPGVFSRKAFIKSWGCHTGESMSKYWRRAIGRPMIGAIGKTDYSPGNIPVLSTPGGRWGR